MRTRIVICSVLSGISALVYAQPVRDAVTRVPVPESGFVSPRQYTSAYFGFVLRLLTHRGFEVVDRSEFYRPLEHFLFATKSSKQGFSMLSISAIPILGAPNDEVQKAVRFPNPDMEARKPPEILRIGGRVFWKNDLERQDRRRKTVWQRQYVTVARGFIVMFFVFSYDSAFAAELGEDIESIRFFDPARAQEEAGKDSHPFLAQAASMGLQSPPDVDIPALDPGSLSGNVYLNSFLGFSYRFPEGWHPSDQPIRNTGVTGALDDVTDSQSQPASATGCTRVLSSFTKYPEQDRILEFNPRITILVADPICFVPDLKFPTSLQDKPAIASYGQALFRSLAGTRFIGWQKTKLLAVNLAGHTFLQIPSTNGVPLAGSALLRKAHTEFVLTSMRNCWVFWLLEGDTESELNNLMRTSISFNASGHPEKTGADERSTVVIGPK